MSGDNHELRALLDEVDVALDRCEARGAPVHPADRAAVVAARAYLAAPSDDAARVTLYRACDDCSDVPFYGGEVSEADGEPDFSEARGAAGLAAAEIATVVLDHARYDMTLRRRRVRAYLQRADELLGKDDAT